MNLLMSIIVGIIDESKSLIIKTKQVIEIFLLSNYIEKK